jgi:glycosyltransferase involved in cell wall biosynthesis
LNPSTYPAARGTEAALRRAAAVAEVAAQLKAEGFVPDLIIGHHGWGELLNLQDVWDGVKLLGYFEYFYHAHGLDVGFDPLIVTPPGSPARVRAQNAVNLLALTNPGCGQTPTAFQRDTYPTIFHDKIDIIPEGVDLGICAPDPAARDAPLGLAAMARDPALAAALDGVAVQPAEQLVTYVNMFLEPVRGMQTMMRALPRLLARPGIRVAIVGADDPNGYGPRLPNESWKAYFLREMRGQYDDSRVHFMGAVDHENHLRLLRRSDCHVYLTYPFVLSWSLREALACGCAVVASDTPPLHEFIRSGWNGIMTPFFDHDALAARVHDVLGDRALAATLRANARADAQERLSLAGTLDAYAAVINRLTGRDEVRPSGVP